MAFCGIDKLLSQSKQTFISQYTSKTSQLTHFPCPRTNAILSCFFTSFQINSDCFLAFIARKLPPIHKLYRYRIVEKTADRPPKRESPLDDTETRPRLESARVDTLTGRGALAACIISSAEARSRLDAPFVPDGEKIYRSQRR